MFLFLLLLDFVKDHPGCKFPFLSIDHKTFAGRETGEFPDAKLADKLPMKLFFHKPFFEKEENLFLFFL